MLGRTLAGRGVASAVLQTHATLNSTSQCSMFLAWMAHRNTGASASPTPPKSNPSTHLHTSTSSILMKNCGVHSYLLETQNCFPGTYSHSYGAQTYSHHMQTTAMPFLPFIATRGLATLTTACLNKKDVQNRSLPYWCPKGVVMVGCVMVDMKGMAKDVSGFKNLHGRISSLQAKKRVQRKKKKIQEESEEVRQQFIWYSDTLLISLLPRRQNAIMIWNVVGVHLGVGINL